MYRGLVALLLRACRGKPSVNCLHTSAADVTGKLQHNQVVNTRVYKYFFCRFSFFSCEKEGEHRSHFYGIYSRPVFASRPKLQPTVSPRRVTDYSLNPRPRHWPSTPVVLVTSVVLVTPVVLVQQRITQLAEISIDHPIGQTYMLNYTKLLLRCAVKRPLAVQAYIRCLSKQREAKLRKTNKMMVMLGVIAIRRGRRNDKKIFLPQSYILSALLTVRSTCGNIPPNIWRETSGPHADSFLRQTSLLSVFRSSAHRFMVHKRSTDTFRWAHKTLLTRTTKIPGT